MKKNKNISSGAQKVEKLNKGVAAERDLQREKTESERELQQDAVAREREHAEERLQAAIVKDARKKEKKAKNQEEAAKMKEKVAKIEEKQAKKREREAVRQHRRAEMASKKIAEHEKREAKKEERLAAMIERREHLREQQEERRAERAAVRAQKAEERREKKSARAAMSAAERREQKRVMREMRAEHRREEIERRKEAREARRAERAERRKDKTPGYGGWITAVVSLSVMVLALGAVVTAGYFNLQNARTTVSNGYESSMYELMSFVDNMDTNLSKARVASGRYEQQKLLTNIVIESELCENCLESFPVSVEKTQNLTSFINRVSDYSRSLLNKLAKGGTLSEEDEQVIEYMYETTSALKQKLNETVHCLNHKEIEKILDGNSKVFDDGFAALENDTIQMPKMIYDGPFAQSANRNEVKLLEGMSEVSEQEARDKLSSLFEKYDIQEINGDGSTKVGNMELYNFTLRDQNGRAYSAQITKKGGVLAMFDSFEVCKDNNFNVEACVEIAQNFLQSAGFDGMREVWVSEAGTECTINFAYEQNGVTCYSDLIKVKVCEEKGMVIGLEANSFIRSHTDRKISKAKISMEKAEAALHGGFEVETQRLCLIPLDGTETLAYEFSGTYGGKTYYVYIDAQDGSECELFTVVGSNQGTALM